MSLFFQLLKSGATISRIYQLQGTSGSPVLQSELGLQPANATVQWTLSGNASGNGRKVGFVQFDDYSAGDTVAFKDQQEFTVPATGFGSVWVRLTHDDGVCDNSSHAIDGSTWHELEEGVDNIWWVEQNTTATPESCTVQVEIATDSGGTDIVATGYYRALVSSEP